MTGALRRCVASGTALAILVTLVSFIQVVAPPQAAAAATPSTVAVGWTHSCLIRSGKAYCWGDNTHGQLGNNSTVDSTVPVPVYTGGALSGVTLTQITAGNGFTCALSSTGAAYCWGANNYGELGVNSAQAASSVPVAVSTAGVLSGKTLTTISAGEYHVCGVAGGAAYCWGWNHWGQLGNGSTVNATAPVAVSTAGVLSGKTISSIATGYAHTCAVSSAGAAYCWGGGGAGQLGNTATGNSNVPVAVTTSGALSGVTLSGVTAGYEHTCALSGTGTVFCWGRGTDGELGDSSTANSDVPVAVTTSGALSGVTVSQITAGYEDTCALDSTGAGYCWGHGTAGELGNGSTSGNQSAPQAVSASGVLSGKTLSQLGTGQYHTCAVDSVGGSYCWGQDTGGQLGDPATATTTSVPIPVVGSGPTTVTNGYSHSCSINPNGAAYCWGDDTDGDLGNNTTTTTPQQAPVAVYTGGVLSGVTLTQITAGQQFTCALSTEGKAYCWGSGSDGQLGNGTSDSSVPVEVSTSGVLAGVTLIQIAAGNSFACAIATTGKAYCWGYGADGELGNGATSNSGSPVAVSQAAGVVFSDLGPGYEHSCALTTAGTGYCWGYNSNGQLGDNTTCSCAQDTPVAVDTSGVLSGLFLTEIASGDYFTCAAASTGAAYCWGDNNDGQLGNNTAGGGAQSVAVAVTTTGVLSGVTLTQIGAGQYHTCALSSAGAGYCWGFGTSGQLGNGGTSSSSVAGAVTTSGVLSGEVLTQISAGYQSTCGMTGTAVATCWGLNGNGQLGNNSLGSASAPASVVSLAPGSPVGVTAMPGNGSMTVYFTAPTSFGAGTLNDYTATATPGGADGAPASGSCTVSGTSCTITGLTNGGVYMVTVTTNTTAGGSVDSAPVSATVWPPTTAIAAGSTHSCTISSGKAYCWGDDTYGELGDNTTSATPRQTPVAVYTGGVLSGVTLTQITTGNGFTCALSSAGAVYCWGLGTSGQLGDGLGTTSSVPVAVTTSGVLSGVTVTQISAGSAFACAAGANGAAYCWGAGGSGQLGNGSSGNSNVPVAVSTSGVLSGVTVTQVAAGSLNACAVSAAGAAYCWGLGTSGQLGNSGSASSSVPVAVTTSGVLSGVTLTGIAGGSTNFMCALSSTGQAYCWGTEANGQLGNNTTSGTYNAPVAVVTSGALYGTSLAGVATGYDHTCALSPAGAAYCWGDGGNGELGNSPSGGSSVPAAVYTGGLLSGDTLSQISGGQYFTCAQSAAPYVYCWGLDSSGQLGNNSLAQSTSAVYVAPQAPTGLAATTTSSTVTPSWTAPAFTNGGSITGYSAAANPGNETCTTTGATSCTITGLTAGTTYTITVTATGSPTGSATSPAGSVSTPVAQLTSPGSLTWSLTGSGLNQSIVDKVSADQQFTATDDTGSGAGWHIVVSATTLTSGANTLPDSGALAFNGSTSSLSSASAPSTTCVSSCTLPANTTTYPVSITTAASSPDSYTIYDTQAGSGMGQVTIGGSTSSNPAGWWVKVPANARLGSYTTTVNLELISGP